MSDLVMASIVAMSYGSHISHSSGIPPPMKTPIKPFLVEVKRSRSISSPKDAVRLERPVVVEASAPAATTTHSQTRQLAERAFKALAAGSGDERGHIATAQSVFAPRPKSDAVPQIAQTDLLTAGRQEPPPLVETVHVQGVEASEPGTEAPLKADMGQSDQRRFGHNPVWGPGERWKRRLRHLRLA
jgi:hypothetical protein